MGKSSFRNIRKRKVILHDPCSLRGSPSAIIVPEIGKGEEKKIARTSAAYDAVMAEAAALHADTLVITSPHADAYVDYFAISPGTEAEGSFGQFGAPQVRIKVSYDKALAAAISEAEDKGLAAGLLGTHHPELDHGTLLPLTFTKSMAM